MKISIVGAGIMGLGAAWALERLGHQVTVFEQGAMPNPLASSNDQHRLIRCAYGAETGYMRMVADAYAIWDRLWSDLGETHYQQTGTLVVALPGPLPETLFARLGLWLPGIAGAVALGTGLVAGRIAASG
jgi:glycine/D-amino acid oxidase-like deaminating enzyme